MMFHARQMSFFWLGVVALFVGFVWLFQGILTPFILGMVIAYILNPLVSRLNDWKWPRWSAVLAILIIFLGFMALALALLLPVLLREGGQLLSDMPGWIDRMQVAITHFASRFGYDITPDVSTIAGNLQGQAGQILTAGKSLAAILIAGGSNIISAVTFILLMPIVAFYMMVDWPRLVTQLDELLPRDERGRVRQLLQEIDRTLAGFIRGQLTVCLVLGLFYGVGLSMIGLHFGFVIGMAAGILSIMPYVGSGFGLIMSTSVAWLTTSDPKMVLAAFIVFIIGQFLEGNFLTPRLVGNNIGLHPLWVIFALMAGGSLMGFTGLLIAVPVAAVIGVMVRFAISEYKKSTYYAG